MGVEVLWTTVHFEVDSGDSLEIISDGGDKQVSGLDRGVVIEECP